MTQAADRARRLPISAWIFVACGIWLIGLGAYFVVLRPPLLPEDPRYIGSSLVAIQAALPGLARWLGRVFTVMGGFMAAAGVLTVFVALAAVPARTRATGWVLAAAGLLTVALMSATNFALDSDFKWVLLVPAVLWLAGLGRYSLERLEE
jgi:hypothetical protein